MKHTETGKYGFIHTTIKKTVIIAAAVFIISGLAEYRDAAWVLQPIGGEVEAIEEYLPSDGNGFYALMDYGRATGDAEIYRVIIQNGELSLEDGEHYSAIDGTLDSFEAINPPVTSFDITDLSGLE